MIVTIKNGQILDVVSRPLMPIDVKDRSSRRLCRFTPREELYNSLG